MMGTITTEEVITRTRLLPAFPRVVTDILSTLDDDNATLRALVAHVERDPVITARVISLASAAAVARPSGVIRDVYTATSLIGMAKIREIVLATSLAEFARGSGVSRYFWEHSVAVGVCAQELSKAVHMPSDYALVAGLLHDVGQLWMAHFYPLLFQAVHAAVHEGSGVIDEVEREMFGLDHAEIGRIIASYWKLPANVTQAIALHHHPDSGLDEPLVPLIHVAEVLSNALDLTERQDNQVNYLSEAACTTIGLDFSTDLTPLFGKIEARSEYACRSFRW